MKWVFEKLLKNSEVETETHDVNYKGHFCIGLVSGGYDHAFPHSTTREQTRTPIS